MCQGRYFFWAQSPEINTNIINILDIPVGSTVNDFGL
jgi:hypothetical protein